MREFSKKEILDICESIRYIDDKLGQFSDHEGDQNGPVWYLWHLGKERFDLHCQTAIEYHRRAIKRWKIAQKMNSQR